MFYEDNGLKKYVKMIFGFLFFLQIFVHKKSNDIYDIITSKQKNFLEIIL